jgi:hypothetical protein
VVSPEAAYPPPELHDDDKQDQRSDAVARYCWPCGVQVAAAAFVVDATEDKTLVHRLAEPYPQGTSRRPAPRLFRWLT